MPCGAPGVGFLGSDGECLLEVGAPGTSLFPASESTAILSTISTFTSLLAYVRHKIRMDLVAHASADGVQSVPAMD